MYVPSMPPLLCPNLKVFGHEVWHFALAGEGTCFYTKHKKSFILHKNQMGISNLRTILTAWACRTGCWAARTFRPCWPGASWDGGIPLTRWGHSPYEMGTFPLPDGCGVPGLLPGVDHWTSLSIWAVSPELVAGQFGRVDHGDRRCRMRKREKPNYCIQHNLLTFGAYENCPCNWVAVWKPWPSGDRVNL